MVILSHALVFITGRGGQRPRPLTRKQPQKNADVGKMPCVAETPPPPAIHPTLLRVHSSTFVCIRVCIPACIIHACLRVGKQAGGAEGRNQYGASIRFALHVEARRVGSYVLLIITKYSTCTTYQSCEGHLYYLQHHMHHAQLSCPNTARHNPKQPPGHPSKEEKKQQH